MGEGTAGKVRIGLWAGFGSARGDEVGGVGTIAHPAHALFTQALTSKFASENSAGLNDIAPAKHGPEVPRSGVSQGCAQSSPCFEFLASPTASEAGPLARRVRPMMKSSELSGGSLTRAGEMSALTPYRVAILTASTAEGRFRGRPRLSRSPTSGNDAVVSRVVSSCRSGTFTNRCRASRSSRQAPWNDARVESGFAFRRRVVAHTTADRTEGEASATPAADAVPVDRSGRLRDVIVDEVLDAIEGTDSGRKMSPEQRDATDANLAELESIGKTQAPNSLADPLIFGDYDVTYVSTGRRQIGNPAGGRFRGGLGAMLFRTIGLEQNLYEPNVVVNRVAFLVLGLIPGEVVLNGTFAALTAELAEKNEKGEFIFFYFRMGN